MSSPHYVEKSWEEFRNTGLLWFVNRMLHVFGYVITFEYDDEDKVKRVFPARTTYRGFPTPAEETGFEQVTTYLSENIEKLKEEVNE